jgi:hypothetical protein
MERRGEQTNQISAGQQRSEAGNQVNNAICHLDERWAHWAADWQKKRLKSV